MKHMDEVYAGVAQWKEAAVLETVQDGFESHLPYYARVWNPFNPAGAYLKTFAEGL